MEYKYDKAVYFFSVLKVLNECVLENAQFIFVIISYVTEFYKCFLKTFKNVSLYSLVVRKLVKA